MKKVLTYIVLAALFLTGFFIAQSESGKDSVIKRTKILLGTVVEIQIRGGDTQFAERAISKAFDEIKRIDDEFSVYDAESPIWKINHSASERIITNAEIYYILQRCNEFSNLTGKAFDVSLDTLTELWGFGSNGNPLLPSENGIKEALEFSGWKNIQLLNNNMFQRQNKVHLNFGAIVKGYAVDCAASILKKNGIKDALINAGGEIKQLGDEWVIGVQDPDDQASIIKKLKINEKAVATSGDYEQFFEKNGVRYCHIMDPATGYPAQFCKSVTIIAEDDLAADALATGVFVLGPERGIKLIEKIPGAEAYIIDKNNKEYFSSGFSKYILR